jgi:hypothetical protein
MSQEDKIPPPAYIPPAAQDEFVELGGVKKEPMRLGQHSGSQNQIALAFIDEHGNPVALDANGNQIPVMMVDQFGNPVQPTPEQLMAMSGHDPNDPAFAPRKKDPYVFENICFC